MSSLTSQLITRPSVAPVAAEGATPPAGGAGEALVPASDAERDALAAASAAEKHAAQITGQMEKVASQGGSVPEVAADLCETLQKLAHYIPALVRACQARAKYAEFCLDQAARGVSRDEALKVASEMFADGMFEVPEGKTFADVVDELSQEDIGVFKRAYDLVATGRLTRFGEVDGSTNHETQSAGPIGDSDEEFLRQHAWLLPQGS